MQKTIVPCLIFVPCFIAFMLRILGSSIHIKPGPPIISAARFGPFSYCCPYGVTAKSTSGAIGRGCCSARPCFGCYAHGVGRSALPVFRCSFKITGGRHSKSFRSAKYVAPSAAYCVGNGSCRTTTAQRTGAPETHRIFMSKVSVRATLLRYTDGKTAWHGKSVPK